MAACDTELSNLPLLTGCPSTGEYVLVGNAAGGQGVGLYGRRLWSDVFNCILGSIRFVYNQFTIGQPGAPTFTGGGTVLTINQTGVIQDSAFITLGGSELDRADNTQISYTIAYNSNDIVITFNQGVENGQLYILHYAYVS